MLSRIRSDQPRRGRSRRGQGLVEFAIILPFLILVLGGIVDVSIMFYTGQTVQHASREGARMAVKLEDLASNDSRVLGYVETLIPNTDLYSGFWGGTTVTGISDCDVNDQVTVTVSGQYHFLALNIFGVDSLNLTFPTRMRYEMCNS